MLQYVYDDDGNRIVRNGEAVRVVKRYKAPLEVLPFDASMVAAARKHGTFAKELES